MKKRLLTAALLLAAMLYTGCAAAQTASEPAMTEPMTETAAPTTEPLPETTEASTVPTETTEAATEPVTEETTEETAELTTEPIHFANRLEVMKSAFETRPVPDHCFNRDPEDLTPQVRKAIEEDRGMYGRVCCWCIDRETGDVYVCLNYSAIQFNRFEDYAFYRIDGSSGEVNAICDADWMKENRGVSTIGEDAYGLYWVGGKLLFASYGGFYQIEQDGEFVMVDGDWEPQGGYGLIGKDTVKLAGMSGVYEYDPRTGSKTPLEEYSGEGVMVSINEYLMRPTPQLQEQVLFEGENGTDQKVIFEWE
ncbi:MAG: hypothetical protein J5851_06850 [Oscillospiraceae bacterium]|nr:hypothetical protein [Oscillospiraceae bacterium]